MGDYLKKKNGKVVVKQEIVRQESVDANAIAEAVVKAIESKQVMNGVNSSGKQVKKDGFDEKFSMSKLAEAMVIQRGNNTSNFENLGNTKEIKKDVDSTVDLLKDIDD